MRGWRRIRRGSARFAFEPGWPFKPTGPIQVSRHIIPGLLAGLHALTLHRQRAPRWSRHRLRNLYGLRTQVQVKYQ